MVTQRRGLALPLVRFQPPHPSIFEERSDPTTSSEVTVSTILGNTSSIVTVVEDVWDIMTSNPLLMVFIAASLLSLGFTFYRKAKRAARG